MENKSITITEEEFRKKSQEVIDNVLEESEGARTKTSFVMGLLATTVVADLQHRLFDEDEEVAK